MYLTTGEGRGIIHDSSMKVLEPEEGRMKDISLLVTVGDSQWGENAVDIIETGLRRQGFCGMVCGNPGEYPTIIVVTGDCSEEMINSVIPQESPCRVFKTAYFENSNEAVQLFFRMVSKFLRSIFSKEARP